jgi:hypothetical protein
LRAGHSSISRSKPPFFRFWVYFDCSAGDADFQLRESAAWNLLLVGDAFAFVSSCISTYNHRDNNKGLEAQ